MTVSELRLELDREDDGRWIAEVPAIPGVIVYGASPEEAVERVRRLAADVIADRRSHGEMIPDVEPQAIAVTMMVDRYVAVVASGGVDGLLVGSVDGLPGAHTQAASLDELYLNLGEVIALVTESDSVPEDSTEERLSIREN